jgi:hypothetical protein
VKETWIKISSSLGGLCRSDQETLPTFLLSQGAWMEEFASTEPGVLKTLAATLRRTLMNEEPCLPLRLIASSKNWLIASAILLSILMPLTAQNGPSAKGKEFMHRNNTVDYVSWFSLKWRSDVLR